MINSFYFSHDFNARNDPKIKRLFMRHGVCGYGLFWAIIEDLYQNANALPTDYESIAFDLRSDCETVKSVINDFGLFVITENIFHSDSVQRRLDARSEKVEKAKKSAQARWDGKKKDETSDSIANALENDANAMLLKERKEKEIKGKEIKDISSSTPPEEKKPEVPDFVKKEQQEFKDQIQQDTLNSKLDKKQTLEILKTDIDLINQVLREFKKSNIKTEYFCLTNNDIYQSTEKFKTWYEEMIEDCIIKAHNDGKFPRKLGDTKMHVINFLRYQDFTKIKNRLTPKPATTQPNYERQYD